MVAGSSGSIPPGGTTGQVLKKTSNTDHDVEWGAAAAGSEAFPVGSVFIAVVSTNPATLLGYGTWNAFGAGRVLVGVDTGDPDFDTVEETGGAKTVAGAGTVSAPTFTGTPFTSVINHTHAVTVNDPGHVHAIRSQTATTGSVSSWEHGAIDTSSAAAETLNSDSATTGITATTANPAGGVSSITPSGTVSAPTFTGSVTSVVQPYVTRHFWKRTAWHCLSLTARSYEVDTGAMPKRPRDPNQLAKMIVDLTTRATTEPEESKMAARGRLGGLKGGAARAATLPEAKRKQIARKAAAARWKGREKKV